MDDIEGDPSQAPGQKAYDPSRSVDSGPAREQPTPPQPAQPAAGGDGRPAGPAQPSPSPQAPAAVPQAPGGAGAITPDSLTADNGAYSLDPANPGGDGRAQRKPTPPQPYVDPALSPRALGLGGSGLPGVANLTAKAFEDVVGEEQLRKERLADGAARRAKHRGSFDYGKFQKYLPNVENYEPSVKLGNTTSLNAAQVPFASYLNAMHNRIHPVFAVEFLSTLDGLGPTDPMNGHLVTHLEIVLSGDDGRLVRMGVTKTSGVTAYDMSAMSSIERAGPYGPAPDMIKSPDGNVYLHWEFHRDPFHACSSRNAKPYLLKNPPKIGEAVPTPPKPPAPRKEGDPPPPLLPLRE